MPFHERIQFLNSKLVSCHPSVALNNFLHHGILHPVLKGLAVLLRSNRIGSRSQQVCGDLPCLWVGEEKEPKSNSNKNFENDINSLCLAIRIIAVKAELVSSLIDL